MNERIFRTADRVLTVIAFAILFVFVAGGWLGGLLYLLRLLGVI